MHRKVRSVFFLFLPLLLVTIQHGYSLSTTPPPRSSRPKKDPTKSTSKSQSYYSYKSFKRMGVPAMLYSAFAKAAGRLVRLRPTEILPSLSPADDDAGDKQQQRRRRVALITGSNTGVGFATAKTLVHEHGFEVIIACRDQNKGIQACQAINNMGNDNLKRGGMAVFVDTLDLTNFTSVRTFCMQVQEQYDTIDVLINNAGRNSAQAPTTASSTSMASDEISNNDQAELDVIFQTNFLGHFLLTNLLLDKCQRIVNTASVMHHFPIYSKKDTFQDISSTEFWKRNAYDADSQQSDNQQGNDVDIRKPYSASKLAALLFSIELNRRYGKTKGIQSIAVNPGSVNSDIWRNYSSVKKALFQRIYLTPEQGSTTSVAAAVLDFFEDDNDDAPQIVRPSTLYLQPYWIPFQKNNVPPYPMFEMLGPYKGYCVTHPRLPEDGGIAASKTLFEVCEELVGCKFPKGDLSVVD